ncbi:MAG TPA: YggT family protein [Gemmatimonadaceae bacterium]|nr:YggT family protein [Gemmatimonadaceae bacterium]
MSTFLLGFAVAIDILGRALFFAAAILAVVALVDWLVRTRRISPFNPIARFFRRAIDPLLAPMERRVVRAGGMPQSAPWWMLVALVLGGLVLLAALRFLLSQFAMATEIARSGPRGILYLLIHWTFALLQLALIVRVISGWLRLSPYSTWIRWSYALSEPILRPLRGLIPPFGMIDVTPIIAYFALRILEVLILRAL